eukprot:NODE_93_length_21581_cov_0.291919.p1 type:complete len:1097 gc:universal NODE_93_length_21581_cov_0.291919:630-3920(+)
MPNLQFLKELVSALESNSDPTPLVMAHSSIVSKTKLTLLICGCLNHFKHLPNILSFVDSLRDEELLDENLLLDYLSPDLQVSLELSAANDPSFKHMPLLLNLPFLSSIDNSVFDHLYRLIDTMSLDLPTCNSGEIYIFIDLVLDQLRSCNSLFGFPNFINCGLKSNPIISYESKAALFCTRAMFLFNYWLSKGLVQFDHFYFLISKYSNCSPIDLPLNKDCDIVDIGLVDPSVDPNNLTMYQLPPLSQELLDLIQECEFDEYLDLNNPEDAQSVKNRNLHISNLRKEHINQHSKPVNVYICYLQSALLLLPLSVLKASDIHCIMNFTPLYHIFITRLTNKGYFINFYGFELYIKKGAMDNKLSSKKPDIISSKATTPMLFTLFNYKQKFNTNTMSLLLPHLVCYPQYASNYYSQMEVSNLTPNSSCLLSKMAINAHLKLFQKCCKGLVNTQCKQWEYVDQLCSSHLYYHSLLFNHLYTTPNCASFAYLYLKGSDLYFELLFKSCQFEMVKHINSTAKFNTLSQFMVNLLLKTEKCDGLYFRFINKYYNDNQLFNLAWYFSNILKCTNTTYKQIYYPYLTRLPNLRYFIYSQFEINQDNVNRPLINCLHSMYTNTDPQIFTDIIFKIINTIHHLQDKQVIESSMVVLEDLMTWLFMNGYKYNSNSSSKIPNTSNSIISLYYEQKQFLDPLNKMTDIHTLINDYVSNIKHRLSPKMLDYLLSRIEIDKQLFQIKPTEPPDIMHSCVIFNINDAYYYNHVFSIRNCSYFTDIECMAIGCHFDNFSTLMNHIHTNTREMLHVALTMMGRLSKSELLQFLKIQTHVYTKELEVLQSHVMQSLKANLAKQGYTTSDREMQRWRLGDLGINEDEEEEGEIRSLNGSIEIVSAPEDLSDMGDKPAIEDTGADEAMADVPKNIETVVGSPIKDTDKVAAELAAVKMENNSNNVSTEHFIQKAVEHESSSQGNRTSISSDFVSGSKTAENEEIKENVSQVETRESESSSSLVLKKSDDIKRRLQQPTSGVKVEQSKRPTESNLKKKADSEATASDKYGLRNRKNLNLESAVEDSNQTTDKLEEPNSYGFRKRSASSESSQKRKRKK